MSRSGSHIAVHQCVDDTRVALPDVLLLNACRLEAASRIDGEQLSIPLDAQVCCH